MNTKLIMTTSSFLLGLAGIIMTFFPVEILQYINITAPHSLAALVQIMGALYFSFAMLNWMSKSNRVGGIYNRPIAVANLTHFLIAALALIKLLIKDQSLPYGIWVFAVIYLIFSILFGAILLRHPLETQV